MEKEEDDDDDDDDDGDDDDDDDDDDADVALLVSPFCRWISKLSRQGNVIRCVRGCGCII